MRNHRRAFREPRRALVLPVLALLLSPFTAPGSAEAVPGNAVAAAAGPVVRSSIGLNVRTGPGLSHPVVRRVANRSALAVACRMTGQNIVGSLRTTAAWDRLAGGGFVSDAFVAWPRGRTAPDCADLAGTVAAGIVSAGIVSGTPVNVRSGPGLRAAVVGHLAPGAGVTVTCRVWAENIAGDPVWYRLGAGRYITQAYVRWTGGTRPWLPWCGQAPAENPPATRAAFIARVAGPARVSRQRFGVPASVTIAQAILESGWGSSPLTVKDHGYFGMKCFGDPGRVAVGCSAYATRECAGRGHCWNTRDVFRAYRNATDSFVDHGRLLALYDRYATAMKYRKAPERFARELQRAGYATSPTYAAALIGIMRQFQLYKYDS
ncbi:sporangiospore maturation cell wall hydrolase GsmA [Hamadaea tsunoensis]|uniref:sporangiospore maturation cell wall hydrolase GsmA n=1 Tax=Hamadaea tsunoensis TaxID=53368 RepID=UPI000413D4A0|nr:sporangiospore maturation cell wall hydrolase GsmA [Hamadaea tsunoensis]